MKFLLVKPNQIISMNDYPPLHSPKALIDYYEKLKKEVYSTPIPVIPKSIVISYFKKFEERYITYKKQLQKFLVGNPKADFFMLDGKHRSTASMLAGKDILCVVLKSDIDVKELLKLIKTREISKLTGIKNTLDETLQILEKHFFEHKRFWTVDIKTQLMIQNGDIPK